MFFCAYHKDVGVLLLSCYLPRCRTCLYTVTIVLCVCVCVCVCVLLQLRPKYPFKHIVFKCMEITFILQIK
jgi:hypothetical protein